MPAYFLIRAIAAGEGGGRLHELSVPQHLLEQYVLRPSFLLLFVSLRDLWKLIPHTSHFKRTVFKSNSSSLVFKEEELFSYSIGGGEDLPLASEKPSESICYMLVLAIVCSVAIQPVDKAYAAKSRSPCLGGRIPARLSEPCLSVWRSQVSGSGPDPNPYGTAYAMLTTPSTGAGLFAQSLSSSSTELNSAFVALMDFYAANHHPRHAIQSSDFPSNLCHPHINLERALASNCS